MTVKQLRNKLKNLPENAVVTIPNSKLIWFNIGRKIIKYVLNLIIKRIIQKIFRIRRIRIYDYQ